MVAQQQTEATKLRLTPQEYLARERAAETKSEYMDGVLVAMTGASRPHNIITHNVDGELYQQLDDRSCEVYPQDMRVRIGDGRVYVYPDLVVVCEPPEFEDGEFDVLLNPTVIIEVLSPSTEGYDRGRKASAYRELRSLRDYVLIAQDRMNIQRYSREGEVWTLTEARGEDAVLEIPSIGCRLALRDVYKRVPGMWTTSQEETDSQAQD